MAFAASQIIRDALQLWAQSKVADLLPQSTIEGGPVVAGDAPALPTLGLDWGSTSVEGSRSMDVEEETDLDTGAGTWLVHYEDVEIAFVWRAANPEDADLFAHEFAIRAAREARESNEEGSRVLHFDVTLGGLTRTAKLYLSGEVVPVRPEENATRSLYTFRVPGSVSYPVYEVESPSDATGLMNIIVQLGGLKGGRSFSLVDIVPEA